MSWSVLRFLTMFRKSEVSPRPVTLSLSVRLSTTLSASPAVSSAIQDVPIKPHRARLEKTPCGESGFW